MCIVTLPPPSSPPSSAKGEGVLATYPWMWDTFCRTFCARIKVFSLARSLSFHENSQFKILHIPVLKYLDSDLLPPFQIGVADTAFFQKMNIFIE